MAKKTTAKAKVADRQQAAQTTMDIPPPATATKDDVENAAAGADSAEDVEAAGSTRREAPVWQAAFDRAWAAYLARDWERCSTEMKLALVDGCDTAVAWDVYSVVEWKLGRKDSARAAVREAAKRAPQDERIKANVARMGA